MRADFARGVRPDPARAARADARRLLGGAINYYYEAEHLDTIVPNQDWYPPSIFFQGMKYMVFGDPALSLPGPR